MTSSNGNIFHVTGPLWVEFTGEFPSQRPVTWNFDVFFDMRLNKRLNKPPRDRWFETPSHSLWRHCNVRGDNEAHAYLLVVGSDDPKRPSMSARVLIDNIMWLHKSSPNIMEFFRANMPAKI